MAPVRGGCTGSRARRLGWLLSLTALGLFPLYVASNSALAALGVAVSLVPGCLLTAASAAGSLNSSGEPWPGGSPTLVEQAAQSG